MKSIPVECIAECDKEGKITPMRVRFENQDDICIIKPIQVLSREEKKGMGVANTIHTFRCQAPIDGRHIVFILQFETNAKLWHLLI